VIDPNALFPFYVVLSIPELCACFRWLRQLYLASSSMLFLSYDCHLCLLYIFQIGQSCCNHILLGTFGKHRIATILSNSGIVQIFLFWNLIAQHSAIWRRHTPFFIAKNTLFFTLIVQRVFSFSRTVFSFHFSPWFLFRSCYIFALRCIYTTGLCWFSSKELSQKGLNGVGKEKKKVSCQKWYKRELV
jgi:hypothetical protein